MYLKWTHCFCHVCSKILPESVNRLAACVHVLLNINESFDVYSVIMALLVQQERSWPSSPDSLALCTCSTLGFCDVFTRVCGLSTKFNWIPCLANAGYIDLLIMSFQPTVNNPLRDRRSPSPSTQSGCVRWEVRLFYTGRVKLRFPLVTASALQASGKPDMDFETGLIQFLW